MSSAEYTQVPEKDNGFPQEAFTMSAIAISNYWLLVHLLHLTESCGLTNLCWRFPAKSFVWIFGIFVDNSGNTDDFTKYLKESCRYCSD